MAMINVWADRRAPGTCRSCHATITWSEVVASGKRMPFDVPFVPARTFQDPASRRLIEVVDTTVTAPHHATCPQGRDWRRP